MCSQLPSALSCRLDSVCVGPDISLGPKSFSAKSCATRGDDEVSAIVSVECAAVARVACVQLAPLVSGAPQLTIRRSEPTLISNASVPACASVDIAAGGAQPTSTTIAVGPMLRPS